VLATFAELEAALIRIWTREGGGAEQEARALRTQAKELRRMRDTGDCSISRKLQSYTRRTGDGVCLNRKARADDT
jgi:hypothetical protein